MKPDSQAESALVVGAGIVGIACAHYLSRAGLRVTVVDRKDIGGACSYANCGYICPSHVLPLTEPAPSGWRSSPSSIRPRRFVSNPDSVPRCGIGCGSSPAAVPSARCLNPASI